MPYIPHTDADRSEMLSMIGVGSVDDLFADIPESLRVAPGGLDLPPALDEAALISHLRELAKKNSNMADTACFLGAGIYHRYVPAVVGAMLSRGEFLTAYTPYQPEFSQGYLQTIYEFQSMVAELYGMDVANASMYDGATALAEAAILACGATGRDCVVVGSAVHPNYRKVLKTYCWAMGVTVREVGFEAGATPTSADLTGAACLLVQSPNFFGVIEDLGALGEAARKAGALFVVSADPISAALLKPPGAYGADVVVGEGQPMGVAMGLGGPLVGLFTCKTEHVRRIPGRIVGRTHDKNGRPGYVMTLRTREQDIRREKATSNICTNEALMALANAVYLSAMGRDGLRGVAEASARNARYAIRRLGEAGAKLRFPGRKVFYEFVIDLPQPAAPVRDELLRQRILAGLPLGDFYDGMENSMLVATTELCRKDAIDRYAAGLAEVLQ